MVRVHIAEWSAPTRKERVVILFATHLITLMALFTWTVGGPWSTTPASNAASAPRAAAVVTVGSGYEVRQHDWQPAQVGGVTTSSAILIRTARPR
jgi:hypothetical protein